ncbi:LOW QUALITY PROTEIN: hypothetical protein PHMEG_00021786 [Phytophthora megakarya]|uniref:DDE Tnp4 domain-containing protein n=1 Tax=Phytophthora megakarya TaxID=4795 RepID=A0A225VMA5_9STRA|nr:LOW QUALITY PROTEIN: hypothetical protein PHMEG_00021786 [Phytophthora megakarya]
MVVIRQRLDWSTHAKQLLLEDEFKQLLSYIGAGLAVDPFQSARRAKGEPCISGRYAASMFKLVGRWELPPNTNHNRLLLLGFGPSARTVRFLVALELSTGGCVQYEFHNVAELLLFSGHYQRYGLNVQACADHQCKFTVMACRSPGRRNDSAAFMQWSLSKVLSKIRGPYFVVGANAYPQTRVVLTPYNQDQLQGRPERDSSNFFSEPMQNTRRDGFWVGCQQMESFKGTPFCQSNVCPSHNSRVLTTT